jgi:hypothetical protein
MNRPSCAEVMLGSAWMSSRLLKTRAGQSRIVIRSEPWLRRVPRLAMAIAARDYLMHWTPCCVAIGEISHAAATNLNQEM